MPFAERATQIPKVASIKTPCHCFTASPIPSRCRRSIEGYFDFVVPPLEGFWWQDSPSGDIDYVRKDDFNFISCIRLPDFVTLDDFDWAVAEATTKKKLDFSAVELLKVDEGLCVQCMHTGPYDNEPATVNAMNEYTTKQGYLSDPRKSAPEKLKTVVRHPIKRAE